MVLFDAKDGGRSDMELVALFAEAGHVPSFEALYDRHADYIFRVALRMVGNREAAEDATQEAWIRASRAMASFRGQSAFRTWICGIAINCCRETWRKRRLPSAGSDDVPVEPAANTPDPLDAVAVRRALNLMDQDGREALILHDVLGHTHDEIARILGIAPGTSKSRLFRARRTLRGLLDTK